MDKLKVYTEGNYAEIHPNWHVEDAPTKARELLPAINALLELEFEPTICDVGTGVGAVPAMILNQLSDEKPKPHFIGMDVSPYAIKEGRKTNPEIQLIEKSLDVSDGPFTAVMFVDVLEHLDSPSDMLALANQVASYLIVRQPLLDNFGIFRHDKYAQQRKDLGHISYFNANSFHELAGHAGWLPVKTYLVAPWEMGFPGGVLLPIKILLTKISRRYASFLLEGFYLTGLFKAKSS